MIVSPPRKINSTRIDKGHINIHHRLKYFLQAYLSCF